MSTPERSPWRELDDPSGSRRKSSQFTYRHLAQLAQSSPNCPIRVITHVDLDAFYAQCECVRLGVPDGTPLAVQQWSGLIAVNYPAREFGIHRHAKISEAKKMCPELVCQHVATWKEGDERWGYHDDAAQHQMTHKAALDPYRLESRRIMACIKETLPAKHQMVEKAGIDEVFVDLSAHVHSILLERYPELAEPPPHGDLSETLPLPPTTALDWQADALVDLDSDEIEFDDPDWDDIAILIGSEITKMIRKAVFEKLKYTCSGGIARNKLLAKLGSAYKKPNSQTVIRNRAIQKFLSGMDFTKIRNLGGKMGKQVVASFETEKVGDMLSFPVGQLKKKLGNESGIWVYEMLRGIDHSEVNSRTAIKSMLSTKAFNPGLSDAEQALRWLRTFVADVFSRLLDEGGPEKRRPRTMTLHHTTSGHSKSRLANIPLGRPLNKEMLFEMVKMLFNKTVNENQFWPCSHLSLSISNFEETVMGNRSIGAFLLRGEVAKASSPSTKQLARAVPDQGNQEKRRRLNNTGPQRFFKTASSQEEALEPNDAAGQPIRGETVALGLEEQAIQGRTPEINLNLPAQRAFSEGRCGRCGQLVEPTPEALQSHDDWHYAKALQDDEGGSADTQPKAPAPKAVSSRSGPGGQARKREKGQGTLKFGSGA